LIDLYLLIILLYYITFAAFTGWSKKLIALLSNNDANWFK